MAQDFGRPNGGNYYKNSVVWDGQSGRPPEISFPVGADFAFGFWVRLDSNNGTSFQYLFSTGPFAAVNTINIYTVESSNAATALRDKWHAATKAIGMSLQEYKDSSAMTTLEAVGDGVEKLVVFQRVSGRLSFHVCPKGGTAVINNGGYSASANAYTIQNLWFGCRSDLDAARRFKEKAAQAFILGRSLTEAEILDLAQGDVTIADVADPGDILAYWDLESPSATAPDLSGNGRDLTMNGAPVYAGFDFVGGEPVQVDLESPGATCTPVAVGGALSTGYLLQSPGASCTPVAPGMALETDELPTPVVWRPNSGDIDVAGTVITNGGAPNPTIALRFLPETNENAGNTAEIFYAGVSNLEGRSPTFTIDFNKWRTPTPPANNKMWWIRSGEDWLTDAKQFDNRTTSGSLVTFWNDAPFDVDDIEIALTPPVSYARLLALLTEWEGKGVVFEPPCAVAFRAANPGAPKFAYYEYPSAVTPNGIDVGGVYAFAVGVTDPARQPLDGAEKRGLCHDWIHAGEQTGLHAMVRLINRLTAASPGAEEQRMLREFGQVFYFVNTAGMFGGMTRGAAEAGRMGNDTNRAWWSSISGPAGVSNPILSINATCAAQIADFGLTADGTRFNAEGGISWHGSFMATPHFLADFSGTGTGTFAGGAAQFAARLRAHYGKTVPSEGAGGQNRWSVGWYRQASKGRIYNISEMGYASTKFYADADEAITAHLKSAIDLLDTGWLPGEYDLQSAGASCTPVAVGGALSVAGALQSPGASCTPYAPGMALSVSYTLASPGASCTPSAAGGALVAGVALASSGAVCTPFAPGGVIFFDNAGLPANRIYRMPGRQRIYRGAIRQP